MSGEDVTRDESFTFDILIMRNIDRMIIAKSNNERWKYWIYFSEVIKLMSAYIPMGIRTKMEASYVRLIGEISTIKASAEHDQSKKEKILQLQYDFADEYEYLLSKALSRTGLIKVKDEGEIDVEDIDIKTMQEIITRSKTTKQMMMERGLPTHPKNKLPMSFETPEEKIQEEDKEEDSEEDTPSE